MNAFPSADLTETLQSDLGEGLRAVAVADLSDRSYEVVYIREDIDAQYTDEMREEIFEEIVLENIAEARQTDLFPPLGRLDFTVRVFERGINLVGWDSDEAVFVGLTDDESLIPAAIAACRREL